MAGATARASLEHKPFYAPMWLQAITRKLIGLTGEAHNAQQRSRLVGADDPGGDSTGKVRWQRVTLGRPFQMCCGAGYGQRGALPTVQEAAGG